jgi:hypothetical protein
MLDNDKRRPTINPINIIADGSSFIVRGMVTLLLLIGLIQDSMAPEVTAIEDRISIGVLMLLVSLVIIHGVELFGDSIVAIENRIV